MKLARLLWLLSSLAIVLVGCSSQEDGFDTFSFTEKDASEISAILDELESGEQSGAMGQEMGTSLTGATTSGIVPAAALPEPLVLDVSEAHRFDALRSGLGAAGDSTLRVTNAFVNVRSGPNVQSEKVEELAKGDRLKLLSFPNAAWAEVELLDGRKGYVNTSYIALLATEQTLPAVKQKYEGQYFVDFAFLNVRDTPSSQGQKLGELGSNVLVKPLAVSGEWARVAFEGKEGFVSTQYLKPFLPSIIIRQESFTLPILRYRGDETGTSEVLVKHLALLKSWGKKLLTLREFLEILEAQEERDVRIPPGALVLTFSDLTPTSIKEIGDALRATGVFGTFFLETSKIGPDGISPALVTSLAAGGQDIEAAGHSGGDLRALTNAQVLLDLTQSRQILKDLTGKDPIAIAYPGGGVNDRVVEQALETGFLFGVTLNPGATFDRAQFLRLPSNLVSPGTPEGTLRALVGN